MPTQPKSTQPAYLLAGVLFTVIALVALIALFMLRSKADTAEQLAGVTNTAPTADSITVSDTAGSGDISGSGFTTNEGIVRKIYVRGQLTDLNGCHNINNAKITLYRSSISGGASCAPDTNNCYTVTLQPTDFQGCNTPADTTVTFETNFDMVNYVDPTDAGSPYEGDTWVAKAVVTDNSADTGFIETNYEVNSLAAFSVPNAINYNTVSLGSYSDPIQLTFSNTGNRDVDSDVYAVDDMVSNQSGFDNILASAVHYSLTSGFTYGTGDTAVAKSPSTDLALALVQQTEDGVLNIPTTDTYWRLHMPSSGVQGTYTNTVVFTAKAAVDNNAPLVQQSSLDFSQGDGVEITAVDLSNNVAYISANYSNSINVIDVSDSANPIQASTITGTLSNNVTAMTKVGNYLYLASNNVENNFQIIDLTNSSSPVLSTPITGLTDGVKDMVISGNYAYLIGGSGSDFAIVNTTNKTSPAVVLGSVLNLPNLVNSVAINGNYAYIYTQDALADPTPHHGYLNAYDVSTPSTPTLVGTLQTYPESKVAVNDAGNLAYVVGNNGDFSNTVQVVSTLTPSNMTPVTSISINHNVVNNVVVNGDYVYVSDKGAVQNSANINIVNATDPYNMSIGASTRIGAYNADGSVYNITVAGNYVYAAGKTDGVYYILNGAVAPSGPHISSMSSTSFVIGTNVIYNNGGNDLDLIINGSGFVEGDTVTWNSGSLPAGAIVHYISPTEMEVLGIPAATFQPSNATFDVRVRNEALEQSSNAMTIEVLAS